MDGKRWDFDEETIRATFDFFEKLFGEAQRRGVFNKLLRFFNFIRKLLEAIGDEAKHV